MKTTVFLLILAVSSLCWGSRARLQALNNSYHLIDPAKVYTDILNIHYTPNVVLLETGTTTVTGATDHAEGLVTYGLDDDTRLAVGIGHQPAAAVEGRTFVNALAGTTYELAQNPVYAVYGWRSTDTLYALGLYNSGRNDKLTGEGEGTTGITGGIELGRFQVYGDYTLANDAMISGDREFAGDGALSFTVNYLFETTIFYLTAKGAEWRSYTGAVEDEYHRVQSFTLGLADSRRRGRNDTFWGMQVVSVNVDCRRRAGAGCDDSASSVLLPFWLGLEVQALENFVFRGSVVQTVLINQSKDRVGYPAGIVTGATGAPSEFSAGPNSTVVAMGAGLQFNRVTVDGTLSAASGTLDSTNLLSQVGVTYRF